MRLPEIKAQLPHALGGQGLTVIRRSWHYGTAVHNLQMYKILGGQVRSCCDLKVVAVRTVQLFVPPK